MGEFCTLWSVTGFLGESFYLLENGPRVCSLSIVMEHGEIRLIQIFCTDGATFQWSSTQISFLNNALDLIKSPFFFDGLSADDIIPKVYFHRLFSSFLSLTHSLPTPVFFYDFCVGTTPLVVFIMSSSKGSLL